MSVLTVSGDMRSCSVQGCVTRFTSLRRAFAKSSNELDKCVCFSLNVNVFSILIASFPADPSLLANCAEQAGVQVESRAQNGVALVAHNIVGNLRPLTEDEIHLRARFEPQGLIISDQIKQLR